MNSSSSEVLGFHIYLFDYNLSIYLVFAAFSPTTVFLTSSSSSISEYVYILFTYQIIIIIIIVFVV